MIKPHLAHLGKEKQLCSKGKDQGHLLDTGPHLILNIFPPSQVSANSSHLSSVGWSGLPLFSLLPDKPVWPLRHLWAFIHKPSHRLSQTVEDTGALQSIISMNTQTADSLHLLVSDHCRSQTLLRVSLPTHTLPQSLHPLLCCKQKAYRMKYQVLDRFRQL